MNAIEKHRKKLHDTAPFPSKTRGTDGFCFCYIQLIFPKVNLHGMWVGWGHLCDATWTPDDFLRTMNQKKATRKFILAMTLIKNRDELKS